MALVTKIKEYCEKAGMKQAELAELVNARRETIVHLENGKYNPSLKLAMDIATFFAPRLINAITSFYACASFYREKRRTLSRKHHSHRKGPNETDHRER